MKVEVTVPISFTKSFNITQEIDFDEEWMKVEGWSEEEYIEEYCSDIFLKKAEQLMEQELNDITLCDCEFDDYESEFNYD